MGLPDYIDNKTFKLEDILRQIIEDEEQLIFIFILGDHAVAGFATG